MNVFIGNFKMCSCQCHIIQATVVIVRDEKMLRDYLDLKNRKQQNVEVKNNICS